MTTAIAFKAVGHENPVYLLGDRYRVLLDKHDTGGAIGLIHCAIQPGGGPPPHLNEREDLIWYVLENELTFYLGARTQRVAAGESLFIPKETTDYHTFHNDTPELAIALLMVTPGGFEGFLREAGVPEGVSAPEPTPELVAQMTELGRRYGMDMKAP